MIVKLGEYEIVASVSEEPWYENCYLVRHIPSGKNLLIDPGDAASRIVQMVSNHGENLKNILITHAHHDHVGAVADLHQHFGVPCYLHKADARLMRQAQTYALVFDGKQIKPFTAVSFFEPEEVFNIGMQSIKIIFTPGHTPGSVCFDFGGFVFTGDTIMYQYVGRTDTPGANKDIMLSSVSRLLEQLSADTVIFPGHGRSWTVREAKSWWKDAINSPPQYKGIKYVGK